MSDLLVTKISDGPVTRFLLEGKIDETSDYSEIARAHGDHLVLDFDKVTLINSSGIQKWIQFLRGLPSTIKVDFDNCPLRIINQMNLIPAFVGDRKIVPLSFYAPYYCEKCDDSKYIRMVTAKEFADRNNVEAPPKNCPECNSPMEFDGIEKKYFMFLKRTA